MFVYAHPDDEAIAAGGQLPLFREALFLQVTDGAPADNADGDRLGLSRDEYRATRALELRAAFAAGGLPEARHRSLNVPDKEAAVDLPSLTRKVAQVIAAEQPEVIFTHPYEGGHADHDACAFAVHQAVTKLGDAKPLLVESPFYFANPDGGIETGAFLREDDADILTLPLSPEQRDAKQAAFAAFTTQSSMLALFKPMLQRECFRVAPAYDFCVPATSGPAYYEFFIPHLSGVRFAQLAAGALESMNEESLSSCS